MEHTRFYINDGQQPRKSVEEPAQLNLVRDCVLQAQQTDMLEIEVEGKVLHFSMDKDQLAYFLESPLDREMQHLQVPHNESVVIDQLNKNILEHLPSDSLSVRQVEEAVELALQRLNQSGSQTEQRYSAFLASATAQLRRLEDQLAQVDSESTSKSHRVLKFLIVATLAQWLVLFYLTYTGYGWDFCEPIGTTLS